MKDIVSIITPTYNRATLLRTAIESVVAQTYTHWELLIIDDASTDDTAEMVASFNEPRIRYEKVPHGGASKARNRGLDIAQGKWITFLDSDDEFSPQFLERVVEMFAQNPSVSCIIPKGRKMHELWEQGKLVKSHEVNAFPDEALDVAKDLFMRRFIFSMDGFVHAASIRDEGIRFDPNIPRMEDWDYVLTIAEKHPHEFFYLPEVLYIYHQRYGGDGIVSKTAYGEWADAFEQIYQKHKADALMAGQEWYPNRVEKWRAKQEQYNRGELPPYHLYHFRD